MPALLAQLPYLDLNIPKFKAKLLSEPQRASMTQHVFE
jgi:hypothetical protein